MGGLPLGLVPYLVLPLVLLLHLAVRPPRLDEAVGQVLARLHEGEELAVGVKVVLRRNKQKLKGNSAEEKRVVATKQNAIKHSRRKYLTACPTPRPGIDKSVGKVLACLHERDELAVGVKMMLQRKKNSTIE